MDVLSILWKEGEVGMSRDEIIKKFSDYVYYFNAYCTSDAEDHEMLKAVLALLKEQEAEIRQLRLALDIAKGTCKGIAIEGKSADEILM